MILGIVLELIRKVHTVQGYALHEIDKDTVVSEYAGVFEGLSQMPGEYHILLRQDITPVIHPPRNVPVALHDRMKT